MLYRHMVKARCLLETTRGGNTVPVRYLEAVSAPWASVLHVALFCHPCRRPFRRRILWFVKVRAKMLQFAKKCANCEKKWKAACFRQSSERELKQIGQRQSGGETWQSRNRTCGLGQQVFAYVYTTPQHSYCPVGPLKHARTNILPSDCCAPSIPSMLRLFPLSFSESNSLSLFLSLSFAHSVSLVFFRHSSCRRRQKEWAASACNEWRILFLHAYSSTGRSRAKGEGWAYRIRQSSDWRAYTCAYLCLFTHMHAYVHTCSCALVCVGGVCVCV